MRCSLKRIVLPLLIVGGLSSCSQSPGPPSGTASPAPIATAAQPTPLASVATPVASAEIFVAVTDRYESTIEVGQNGYPLLKPVLNSELPEGLGDDLEMLALETPEQIEGFDSKVLPLLRDSFTKESFAPQGRLQAGTEDINYRGLRHLVGLLVQRADQLRDEKDLNGALELVKLPIALAGAMESRPETVSVNLFSAGYASSSLAWIQSSLESGALDGKSIGELQQYLSLHSPNYGHVKETITVDFAQLTNSLATEEGRQMMGIGQVEESTLEKWQKQLVDIYQEATELYLTQQLDADTFNRTVRKASGPIQGLVIDYPPMATMQKRYFAEYKATQLGLALVGPDASQWKELESGELLDKFFSQEPETAEALKALLKIERDDKTVKIMGQMEQFELLAPGVEPVFFEYRKPN
jgi:hypothetical protein